MANVFLNRRAASRVIGLLLILALLVWGARSTGSSNSMGSQDMDSQTPSIQSSTSRFSAITGQWEKLPIFQTRPEGLPPEVRSIVRRRKYGLRWHLAQRIEVSGSANIWAVPGEGMACLLSEETPVAVGAACAPRGRIMQMGLALTLLKDSTKGSRGQRVIVGITPLGIREVQVSSPHHVVEAPVVRGVFILHDHWPMPPDRFRFGG